MKKFNGYDEAKKNAQFSGSEKLPVGAYVCKIMNVRYTEGTNGTSDRIDIQFDIEEGEKKGFFRKQYEANTNDDKKWKGKTSIYVPNDDGSEKDGYTKNAFAKWTDSFEKSNTGYFWDWDENKLKGKLVGIVFGETGTVINGREVTYTEPRFAVPVEKVRNGSAPSAKFKSRNGYGEAPAKPITGSEDFMDVSAVAGEEIPF